MTTTRELYKKLQRGTPPMQKLYAKKRERESKVNISGTDRLVSAVTGGALAVLAYKKGGLMGASLGLLSAMMLKWGLTGHCEVYQALKINTANGKAKRASVKHGEGTKTEYRVTINKPAAELYRFWRNFENLPRFMEHLEAVQALDKNLSHWVAKAPAGMSVEWDAEIINEKENELIAWRSLEGAEINHAGSVQFIEMPEGRGTLVKVVINYQAPAGVLGTTLAKLFGEEPGQQIEDDLKHFKQLVETGEIASIAGQTSGRETDNEKSKSKAAVAISSSKSQTPSQPSRVHEEIPGEKILSHGR
ncbi:MAG: SRPBCC family protein [Acidobacteriota bacterium]